MLARRAIDGSEMNPRLWLDLGRVLWRCNRLDEAEEALRRVCGCHPGSKVTEEHQNLLSEFQGALAAS